MWNGNTQHHLPIDREVGPRGNTSASSSCENSTPQRQIGTPVPRIRIVAAAQSLGRAHAPGDLRVQTIQILGRKCIRAVRCPKSARSIALRAHGSQIERAVSPAARVLDLGCRAAAYRADAPVPCDHLCDNSRRNHALTARISAPEKIPKRLPRPGLPLGIEDRLARDRTPELPDESRHIAAMGTAIGTPLGIARATTIGALRRIRLDSRTALHVLGHRACDKRPEYGSDLLVRVFAGPDRRKLG